MGSSPREALAVLRAAAEDGRLDALCERHQVRVLTVFGSAARGEATARDLDVAVLFEPGRPGDALGLVNELIDLTSSDDIDLMDLGRAGPVARERGLVGCLALYESESGAFAAVQVAAITARMDTQWLREMDLETMTW